MTTWTDTNKAIHEHNLGREQGDAILREQGDILLTENSRPDWTNQTKNTATWSDTNINIINFNFLIDSTYLFLIDTTYKLIIGSGQHDWAYQNKN